MRAWSRSTDRRGSRSAGSAPGRRRASTTRRPGAVREAFVIAYPPPNVTGALHIGPRAEDLGPDVLIRWHRMRGFRRRSGTGYDHAGIATQAVIERHLAARGQDATGRRPRGVRGALWEWLREYGGTIMNQFRTARRVDGLPARAVHDGRRVRARGDALLRAPPREGLDLPREPDHQLVPGLRERRSPISSSSTKRWTTR